jgi:flagellar capping protein FliD
MDIELDLQRMKKLNNDLKAVSSEFGGADDFSDTVATATGHDGLASAVHDFAHAWNKKRPEMKDGVDKLQQKLETVTKGFTDLDNQLAQAMEDARSQENVPAQPGPKGPR